MKTFKELLIELDACDDAREWAGDKIIEQIVAECERGDWLAWLAEKIKLDKHSLVLVGGHIANTVRHLMTDERSTRAVDICIAYGEGRASDAELIDAVSAASEAAAWSAASEAAWSAASAAGAALAAWAASAEWEARAAGAARAAWEAAWAASADAGAENRKQTADICRQHIGQAIIEQTNKILTQ